LVTSFWFAEAQARASKG